MHRLQPRVDGAGNYRYRFEAARPWIEGKHVLDIGAGRSFRNLHRLIQGAASSSLAVDLDEASVAEMNAQGFDAVVGDAQNLDLGQSFDVLFAGEVIEHLDNYQGFFDSVRRHLHSDGVLVLTTPNVFRYTGFMYRLGRGIAPVNEDHMVWFCETTLRQLCQRMGFDVVQMGYIGHRSSGRLRSLVSRFVRALLPDRLSEATILAVARPL